MRGLRSGLRGLTVAATCLLGVVLAGCGAPFYISEEDLLRILNGREYLFAAEAAGVGAYEIDRSTGSIKTLVGSPFGSGCITSLAATPDAAHLYAMSSLGTQLSGFSIDEVGVPQPLAGFPMTVINGAREMAIDPQGRFAYVVHATAGDRLASWSIDRTTGALTTAVAPVGVGCAPAAAIVDGSGRYLYTTQAFPVSGIQRWQLDQTTGAPLALGDTVTSYSTSLTFHPDGYLYALSPFNSDRNIAAFQVQADGTLTDITGGTPYRLGFGPANLSGVSVAVDGLGRFLYATSSETDELFQYRVGGTGGLTITQGLGTANGGVVTTSWGGRYVFVGGDNGIGSGVIYAYRVADDGTLTAVPGSPFPAAGGQIRDAVVVRRY